jgi:hypothetical protein
VPCWTRPGRPRTTTLPVTDRVKLPGSVTGQRGKQDQGGTAEPHLGVGVGGQWSTELVQTARYRLAGPGWQPPPGRGWRGPMSCSRSGPVDCRRVGIAVGTAYI